MAEPVFKDYDPSQATFLPPSLEELIGEDHQVRFISYLIDRMDISKIIATYRGGGASSYHPRLLLKILIYGYVQRISSSRRLAKATRENIAFMWLAGGQRPDFRTINNFRKHRLPGEGLKGIFRQVMLTLVDNGLVDLQDYTVDGTTLEANARTHSAVWAKNAERYRRMATGRIETYFEQIQHLADLEDEQYGDEDLAETGEASDWSSDDIHRAAEQASQALQAREETEQVDKNQLSKAETRLRWIIDRELPKVEKYERQQRTLGERNSYSKTDPDATFMRLKDQSPFDKRLSPAYNLQLGTQNQFILGYSLHDNPSDKVNLKSHLDQLSFSPDRLCADAGYGSLANFELLSERNITPLLKSPTNHQRPKTYSRYNFERNNSTDSYTCPQGRTMRFKQTADYSYADGKTARKRRYECEDCTGCSVRLECCYGEGNRSISFIPALEGWKRKVNSLTDNNEKAQTLMAGRGAEIEAVFGQLKHNDGLRRLAMRGRKMVETEVGLKAIAHNLRKMHKCLKNSLGMAAEQLFARCSYAVAA